MGYFFDASQAMTSNEKGKRQEMRATYGLENSSSRREKFGTLPRIPSRIFPGGGIQGRLS